MEWFNKSVDETLRELDVSKEQGLSSERAKSDLEKYGANELKEQEKKPFIKKLAEQVCPASTH